MVQAAIGTALGALGGAFGNQTRRTVTRPNLESSSLAITQAQDVKKAKLALQNAREERLYSLLSQPEVVGMLMTFAGVTAAQMIPFSDDKVANESIQAIATSCAVLMGLGYAGVGDLTTTVFAGLAGAASLTQLAQDVANGAIEGTASALIAPISNLSKFSADVTSAPFKALQYLFSGYVESREYIYIPLIPPIYIIQSEEVFLDGLFLLKAYTTKPAGEQLVWR